ncbi:sulfotransferase domain-containing protein, partial [Aliarcobacter thereius]|uniref:sulfotransferase domain-containing protein n=1 Tax=Aliarcobacter thereius TaxID=544718 RepID=UPI000826E76B
MSNKNNICPSFLIIGAQKAGTTTLYDILNKTNLFCGSKTKEVGFFSKDYFFNKGIEYYHKEFQTDKITFEATPEYLYYDFVPERIYKYNPNMKFIVLLRNPVDRCYSAWNMFRTFNKNNPGSIYDKFTRYANNNIKKNIMELLFSENFPSFSNSIQKEIESIKNFDSSVEPSFVRRGLYAEQIKRYLKYFKMDNFLFIEQSELKDIQKSLNKICSFLQVEKIEVLNKENIVKNEGVYENLTYEDRNTMSFLEEFYKPYNEELFKLIGCRYNWNDKELQLKEQELNQTKQSLQSKESELSQTKQNLQTKEQELNQTK